MKKVKYGFVLKQTLVIFMFLISFLLVFIHIVNQDSQTLKNNLIIEKQKAVELILTSYFSYYYDRSEEYYIEYDDFTLDYQSEVREDYSILNSRVCFNKCYSIHGRFNHKNKIIDEWTYKSE